LDAGIFNFNFRKVLIIDDVVTTGATVSAIIQIILEQFPEATIEIFSLGWTPSAAQQWYIQNRANYNESILVKEPETYYSQKIIEWVDEDFLSGKTYVSLFET
jgi:hypoxanthine phosphoribosyltransferase